MAKHFAIDRVCISASVVEVAIHIVPSKLLYNLQAEQPLAFETQYLNISQDKSRVMASQTLTVMLWDMFPWLLSHNSVFFPRQQGGFADISEKQSAFSPAGKF